MGARHQMMGAGRPGLSVTTLTVTRGRGASVLSLSPVLGHPSLLHPQILSTSLEAGRPTPSQGHIEAAMVSNIEARLSFSIDQICVTKQ